MNVYLHSRGSRSGSPLDPSACSLAAVGRYVAGVSEGRESPVPVFASHCLRMSAAISSTSCGARTTSPVRTNSLSTESLTTISLNRWIESADTRFRGGNPELPRRPAPSSGRRSSTDRIPRLADIARRFGGNGFAGTERNCPSAPASSALLSSAYKSCDDRHKPGRAATRRSRKIGIRRQVRRNPQIHRLRTVRTST